MLPPVSSVLVRVSVTFSDASEVLVPKELFPFLPSQFPVKKALLRVKKTHKFAHPVLWYQVLQIKPKSRIGTVHWTGEIDSYGQGH
jgi:hypothetical protein